MTLPGLKVLKAGPSMTIQDAGRPGYQRFGVAEGGAVDPWAMAEGAALLGNPSGAAAVEMFGYGGDFAAEAGPIRIALTGAAMKATLDGRPLVWGTSVLLEPDQILSIGAAHGGNYGYLHVGGGFGTEPVLSSRSTHTRARLGGLNGTPLAKGDSLPTLTDRHTQTDMRLVHERAAQPARIRVLWGAQAHWFSDAERGRFLDTVFLVTAKLDRMGIRLSNDGPPIHSDLGLSGLSDAVCLGDIQIPGDGQPAVLLADRQPTGGYPRIATIITADLAYMAQRPPGSDVAFDLVDEAGAIEALSAWRKQLATLPENVVPLHRDPRDIANLLEYNLISGVVSTHDYPSEKDRT